MGRKIPPANDGSNYYTARKGNRIEGVSFQAAILDEVIEWPEPPSRGIKGTHFITMGNNTTWTFQPLTSNGVYSTYSGGGYARTTVAAPNLTVGGGSISWTTGGNGTIFESNTPFVFDAEGPHLTPEERAELQRQYTEIPDHEWTPNVYGQCDTCPHHNMYRRDQSSHLFVIQEPPTQEDWWEQLAS